jgi:hypothetical protein
MIQHAYILPMIISAILSLKAFKQGWPLPYRLFSVYIFWCLLTEIIAWSWVAYQKSAYPNKQPSNVWVFNSFIMPMYIILSAAYYSIIKNRLYKKLILFCATAFSLFAIINILWIQGISFVNSYSNLFADSIVLIYIFLYLEELRKEKEVQKVAAIPMVWIAAGNFIFHLLNLPFILFLNYLNNNYPGLALSFIYMYLSFIFINYILYIKAFLCPTPQQK